MEVEKICPKCGEKFSTNWSFDEENRRHYCYTCYLDYCKWFADVGRKVRTYEKAFRLKHRGMAIGFKYVDNKYSPFAENR